VRGTDGSRGEGGLRKLGSKRKVGEAKERRKEECTYMKLRTNSMEEGCLKSGRRERG